MESQRVFFCIWLLLLNSMFVKFIYVIAYSLFSLLHSRGSTSCFVNKILLKHCQANLLLYCPQLLSHYNGEFSRNRDWVVVKAEIFAVWHFTEKKSLPTPALLYPIITFLYSFYS